MLQGIRIHLPKTHHFDIGIILSRRQVRNVRHGEKAASSLPLAEPRVEGPPCEGAGSRLSNLQVENDPHTRDRDLLRCVFRNKPYKGDFSSMGFLQRFTIPQLTAPGSPNCLSLSNPCSTIYHHLLKWYTSF